MACETACKLLQDAKSDAGAGGVGATLLISGDATGEGVGLNVSVDGGVCPAGQADVLDGTAFNIGACCVAEKGVRSKLTLLGRLD